MLPSGRRQRALQADIASLIEQLVGPRILPFDRQAAIAYSVLYARAKDRGKTLSVSDAQIAAIAQVHDYSVATRDVEAFRAAGARIINPWDS